MSERKLKTVLIVSIILNVFLVGGVAGGLAFWRLNPQVRAAAKPAPGSPRPLPLRFAADGLAPDQQRAFRQTLRAARQASSSDLRSAQAHRRDLAGLFGARDFDRAAVETALTGARTADAAVRARLETAVADYAAALSAEDRAVFARGLARSPTLRTPPQAPENRAAAATENPPSMR
jgi:uncharacterized membrane protein